MDANLGSEPIHVLVAELAGLYEIAALPVPNSEKEFAQVLIEKASRLLGVRRLALVVGIPPSRRVIVSWGFRDSADLDHLLQATSPNSFLLPFKAGGEPSLLMLEYPNPLSDRQKVFFMLFGRRIQEMFVTFLIGNEKAHAEQEVRRLLNESERSRRVLLSIVEDQTRATESLKEKTAFLHSMLNAMPLPVCYKDTAGRYIGVNKAFEAFFGRPGSELIGKTVFDLLPREMADVHHAKDEELLQHHGTQLYESKLPDARGRFHDMVMQKAVFVDANGKSAGVIGAMLDITERKQVEQEMRFRNAILSTQQNVSLDGILVVNEHGKVVSHNQQFVEMMNVPPELIEEQTDDLVLHYMASKTPDPKGFLLAARRVYEQPLGTSRDEITLVDGRVFDTYSAPMLGPDKRYYGRVWFFRDVTEQRSAAERIRVLNEELEGRVRERTSQLEAANKELEAFSYSVSHDLRAPLRSIDGFSQHLLEICKDHLPDEAAQDLVRVRAAAQRMSKLIDDLLGLSRLGRREIRMQQVNLSGLVEDIAKELRSADPKRTVKWIIAPDVTVCGDEQLLRIVLQNLMANAWKFTRHKPEPKIEFGVTEKDGRKVVFIRDNGVGFDMAYASKLFGAFQRLHSESEFEGTGIGLAIVQRIIHRHGGTVWVEAGVNQGAAFFFTV